MIDIRSLREDTDHFRQALKARNVSEDTLDEVLQLDESLRAELTRLNQLKAERNKVSAEVARMKASGQNTEAEELLERARVISNLVKEGDAKIRQVEEHLESRLLHVPNIPHSSVPRGESESDNVVLQTWGNPPVFDFEPLPHWELGPKSGMMDFERAAKLSGARFSILRGHLATLSRALVNFMIELHVREHGYQEVSLPHLVKRETMLASGQLPKFEEELYNSRPDDLFLIPTAEVPLIAQHSNEILESSRLPLKYASYTPCYRREAGSYGKDVRGMIRVHQFDKVELVWFTRPEESEAALQRLTSDAEEVLQRLELPYRVVELCTADLGFASAKTYDLEVWLPSYGNYKEISSCSNTTDFQARRANIRYRDSNNRPAFVHALNGSGVAVGRALVAIIENFQREDGTIRVPDTLVPFVGKEVVG